MLGVAMQGALGAVLLVAALAKLARPTAGADGLSAFGIPAGSARWAILAATIAVEVFLGVGVIAGSDPAAYAAAALIAVFAAVTVPPLLQGRAGAPCACFGGGSRLSWSGVVRNLVLAVGFAVVPALPDEPLTTDEWLGLSLIALLLLVAALAVAVLALTREVGMLRLRAGPAAALDVSGEGPELGGRSELIERFAPGARAEIALAVFSSAGCHVCESLGPAIDSLRAEPSLALEVFDEAAESEAWEALQIPGAPYALALDLAGTVLAKGTFNNLAQLESVAATAERRIAERARLERLGV